MKEQLKKIIKAINGIIPKNDKKIILESSPDFSDNAKVIYEYLLENGKKDYQYIWVVNNYEKYKDKKTKKLKFITKKRIISYLYHVFTSKYILYGNNGVILTNINKQVVVNLTHGMPFKSSKGLLQNDEDFTYLVSTSDEISPILAGEFYSTAKKCIVSGLPRNDVLFGNYKEAEEVVKDFDKFILWLPTYKKHKDFENSVTEDYSPVPLFTNEELLKLNENLKEKNFLLILKFHPAQDLSLLDSNSLTNIYLWKNEELVDRELDLYKLMSKADALITDYSSVSADYLLTDRPIAYIQNDKSESGDKSGFCFDNIDDMSPGHKIKNTKDFNNFMEDLYNNKDKYKKDRKRVRDFYHKYQDGSSTKVLMDFLGL